MEDIHLGPLVNALLFAIAGLLLFGAALSIAVRVIPLDLWKEIGEERNVALAVLLLGIAIAFSLIISSAVH